MNKVPALRIVAFPKGGTAYTDELYRAVEALGIEVVDGSFAGGWLLRNLRRGDWVHLHWPSFGYANRTGIPALLHLFVRWLTLLLLMKAKGARLVWTAHNLMPHDASLIPFLDEIARRIVIACSAVVMVHGPTAANTLVRRFPSATRKVALMHHGHWIDFYPRSISREEARAKLGLSFSGYVYLFIGLCKPYKNIEGLITSFVQVPGESVLLIAGKFPDEAYFNRIMEFAAADERIRIDPGSIPHENMQDYLMACDVVVAPYREILTSGTAMLAMSFGRPVISVASGYLKDMVPPHVGLLFPPDNPDEGLKDALVAARHMHFDESQILQHASQFSFETAAQQLIVALRNAHAGPDAGDPGATLGGASAPGPGDQSH